MKFIITENKLLSVMTDFVKKNYPDALSPLKTRLRLKDIGNSGWGSSMHDYKYYDTIYYTDNGKGRVKILPMHTNMKMAKTSSRHKYTKKRKSLEK